MIGVGGSFVGGVVTAPTVVGAAAFSVTGALCVGVTGKATEHFVENSYMFAKNLGSKGTINLTRESVDDKLARYLLNMDHSIGGTKAKWFKEALGFTQENADELAKQIVFNPNKAVQTAITEHGIKYNQIIPIKGANGKVIDVKFGWIKNNDGVVRLITGIPTKK